MAIMRGAVVSTTRPSIVPMLHTIDDLDEEVSIVIRCTPGDPGCRRTKNGDGWPPSPPEFELADVRGSVDGCRWVRDQWDMRGEQYDLWCEEAAKLAEME